MTEDRLDCVVVGYNDLDFQSVLAQGRTVREHSPVYNELLRSSAVFQGTRQTYSSILNAALLQATGVDPGLDVCNLPSLGVAYLTSFLKRRDFDVDFVNFYSSETERFRSLLRSRPRTVAITTTFYTSNEPIIAICKVVRQESPQTKIVVGGPHIFNICNSIDAKTADYILGEIGADIYIHDSQGEDTLARLLTAVKCDHPPDLSTIPNLFYTAPDGTYQATDRIKEDNDMDANVVDWSLFDQAYYTPTVQLRTARSCAFECAFCRYPAVAGALALNSVDVLEHELHKLKGAGVKNVVFIDDTFNVPLPRFKQICRMMIENRFEFDWFSYFRCSNSDSEAFDLMAEAGCKGTFLGIESGDQTVLDAMNKYANLDRYARGIDSLKARGITTYTSFIVGFPGETEQTVRNTIGFIEETQPDFISAGIWFYDDKTPVADMAEKFGLRGAGFHWHHATMDWKQAMDQADFLYRSVKNSAIMPTYNFDFWSIPYLVGQGFDVERIRSFCRTVQSSLVAGLEDDRAEHPEIDRKIVELFKNVTMPAPDRSTGPLETRPDD